MTTNVGERLYQPEYGSNLHKLVFDLTTDDFEENVVNEIEQKIEQSQKKDPPAFTEE